VRRVGRLFPALWTTIALTFFAATLTFSPDDLERLAGSALHALLCLANAFFLSEVGYFDSAATAKPLLHFWSLSVEEQFYFVWPVVLVTMLTFFRDRRIVVALVGCIALGSLFTANTVVNETAAFYMMPFRIIEFVIGAALVRLPPPSKRLADLSGLLGLGLIFFAALGFDGETEFPGWNALIPCAGTALVLLGGRGQIVARGLALGPMVHVGRISYSLYLCHWPLYVFTRYELGGEEPSKAAVGAILVMSFVVAEAMHHGVEAPLRARARRAADAGRGAVFGLCCALLVVASTFPLAHAWANGGWSWRFGESTEAIEQLSDLDALREASIRFHRETVHAANFQTRGTRVLVVGDSHSRDVSNGLVQVLDTEGYEVLSQPLDDVCFRFLPTSGTGPLEQENGVTADCRQQIDRYLGSKKVAQADVIIFSADLIVDRARLIGRWVTFTRAISKRPGQRTIVMDRTVGFGKFHTQALRTLADGGAIEDVNRAAARFGENPMLASVDEVLEEELADFDGVEIVRKRAILCSESECTFLLEDGALAVWDRSHWTVDGARFFMAKLLERRPDLLSE
jgi:peptidoglycan/LPS O-acetylase OafA/YrhL